MIKDVLLVAGRRLALGLLASVLTIFLAVILFGVEAHAPELSVELF
jgi:hypothetical protein